MKKITPWNKDVERLFDSIAKNQRAYVSDVNLSRSLGRRLPDLFDEHDGFMDIGRIGKSKKSVVVPRIGVQVVPLPELTSKSLKIRRKKKFGVYRI